MFAFLSALMNNTLFKMAFMYGVCIVSHYMSSHLYTNYCVEASFTGFLLSPLMTMSPHCQALRWVIYNGGYSINMMWFIIGNWLLSKLKFEPTVHVFGEKNVVNATKRKHRSRLVPDLDDDEEEQEEDTSSEESTDDEEE